MEDMRLAIGAFVMEQHFPTWWLGPTFPPSNSPTMSVRLRHILLCFRCGSLALDALEIVFWFASERWW